MVRGRSSLLLPLLESLAVVALLWAPVLLLELVYPAAFDEISVSPVLTQELLLAAALWCVAVATAGVAGDLVALIVSARWTSRRPEGRQLPVAPLAAVAASLAVVALRRPLQSLASNLGLSPLAAFLPVLVTASILGGLVAALLFILGGTRAWFGRAAGVLGLLLWLFLWLRQGYPSGAVLLVATTALPLALWLAIRPVGGKVRTAVGALGSLAAAAIVTVALQPSPATAAPGSAARRGGNDARPNVVILLADTLRVDHTSLGGHPITPHLEALAASDRATAFPHALSAASSTVPSVKALFTARSPSSWGLGPAGREPPPADVWTLASAFHRAGYSTGLFSSNGLVSGGGFETGFDRFWSAGGFNDYQSSFLLYRLLAGQRYWWAMAHVAALGTHKIHGATVLRQGLGWIDRASRRKRPFFAYLQIIEPHWPLSSHGYGLVPEDVRNLPSTYSHVALLRLPKGDPRNAPLRVTPQMRELKGRYDEEIHLADALLGQLLDRLAKEDLADRTLVIFVADHGEEFFDHNGFGHGHDIFGEQIRVPLVIRWPRGFETMPRRVDDPVSLLDLAPTLSDLLDLGPLPRGTEGVSLRGLLEGSATAPPVIAESYYAGYCRAAYREGRFKVRLSFSRQISPETTERVMAFDLAADPDELHPFRGPALTEGPLAGLVARARHALQARWSAWPDRSAAADADETEGDQALEQLKSLGYVQ